MYSGVLRYVYITTIANLYHSTVCYFDDVMMMSWWQCNLLRSYWSGCGVGFEDSSYTVIEPDPATRENLTVCVELRGESSKDISMAIITEDIPDILVDQQALGMALYIFSVHNPMRPCSLPPSLSFSWRGLHLGSYSNFPHPPDQRERSVFQCLNTGRHSRRGDEVV